MCLARRAPARLGRKNAAEAGAQWLTEITRRPVTPHAIFGLEFRETLQVTTVRAGTARNVIPAEMVVNSERRFPPGRTVEQAVANLRRHVPSGFGFDVADQAPPGEVCADHSEVKRFVALSGAKLAGKQGWTDVARFTAAGVPAFNYGPGIPDLCHRADEYCPISNLGVVYENLARFLITESA